MHTFEFIRPADSAVAISAAAQSKTAQNATAKLYPREFDAARNFVVRK